MELTVLEKSDNKLKVEVKGESHTLMNILREKAWAAGADQAAYMIEHPYLAEPKIIIRAKNPKKVLQDAAAGVAEEAQQFEKHFRKALKK